MPNLDVLRVALIVALVAALVGVGAWFVTSVAPDVVRTGVSATLSLSGAPAAAWGEVVGMFGSGWPVAWKLALAGVLFFSTVFFLLRVIRWVQ